MFEMPGPPPNEKIHRRLSEYCLSGGVQLWRREKENGKGAGIVYVRRIMERRNPPSLMRSEPTVSEETILASVDSGRFGGEERRPVERGGSA